MLAGLRGLVIKERTRELALELMVRKPRSSDISIM